MSAKPTIPVSKSGPELGTELFALVQCDQGNAFISDRLEVGYSPDQIFGIARGALHHTDQCARKLRRWLKQHGQLTGPVLARKGTPDGKSTPR